MRNDLMERYAIGEPLYENEFIVYPAEDKRMNRLVSIVVPDQSLKADKPRFDRVWASISEAKSLSALRFVEIEDLIAPSPEDGNFYIVEKRPSKTLRQYLDEQEIVAFDRAVAICEQILEGVATLHGAGYAHNALNDQCIYVSEDYSGLQVRIGNLHLISKTGEHIIPPYVPEFGAPEIYASGTFSASPALDIYSTGMIAYKILLPRQTYTDVFHSVMIWENDHQRDQSWKNIHLDPSNILPRLDVLINGFPIGLASVIERMLSRDPGQRQRNGADALQEFRQAAMGQSVGISIAPPLIGSKKATKTKWSPVTIGLIAALVLVCAGVGIVTIPKILGPDPELVASVEAWKAEAENRRSMAIAAKAPERPTQDEARLAFDAGSTAASSAEAAVKKSDYDQALAQYRTAVDRFGSSLVDIAKDDAMKARAAAVDAGTEKAPSFIDADNGLKEANTKIAKDLKGAIAGFGNVRLTFDALAKSMSAMSGAQKKAAEKQDRANRIGAQEAPDFGKAVGLITDAKDKATQWDLSAATIGYTDAAKLFDAMIADVLASKDDAAAAKQKVADVSQSIISRGGNFDPQFASFAPRIAAADGRFDAEAYKQAIAAYQPILADLTAFAAQGFCPGSAGLAFQRVTVGSYPLANVRLMTSSLAELGPMLGIANGAIKIDKAFCIQTHAVTRAEMAAYYNAINDAGSARVYQGNSDMPADDVPFMTAQSYTAWLSQQLKTNVHIPSASEWMAGAAKIATEKQPDNGGIVLQWSATPCNSNGNIAFMAQEGSTFVVCSDASAGGIFRIASDLR
ncbi:protein kinase domain-containing protein [Rhizobium lusitanum]|uniref:non-specific serine/threonine protein kinase n=1 Tax=Rhizobium lusitanum TaxID=293958 RepID=A0A7X0MDM9_9HYPH|nr:serine/threonine protein kinase [Rhizobium lusitanum]MBB6487057.1 hypothetical protein [Rhizobium lusitanum]